MHTSHNLTTTQCSQKRTTSVNCSQIVDLDNPDNTDNPFLPPEVLEMKIQCQLEAFVAEISSFITLVQCLLSYGTSTVVAVGLFLNILSLIVLTRKPMRHSSVSIFLTVLTVYDSLTLTLNFMVGVIRAQKSGANQLFLDSQSLCKLHGIFVLLFSLLSVWTVVAFTIVRYIMVKYPLKANYFTRRRKLVIMISMSLCVFVFSCHKLFFTGFEGDSVFGYTGCKTNRINVPGLRILNIAINTWFPVLLTIIFNLKIIRRLKIQQCRRSTLVTAAARIDEKAARLLTKVSCAYLILITPLGIIQTIELFWNEVKLATPTTSPFYVNVGIIKLKMKWVRAFCFFFYQINFANNFFLYVFSSSGTIFRRTLRLLIGLKPREIDQVSPVGAINVKPNAVQPLPQLNTTPETLTDTLCYSLNLQTES